MAKNINASDTFHPLPSQFDLELLSSLLEPEDATYPWNPADEESEMYFRELEEQFAQDLTDEELTSNSQIFYGKLDTLWSEISECSHYKCNTINLTLDNLQKTLHSAFAASVPQSWLNAIAQKASEMLNSSRSIGDQLLVECVQSVLPSWETEDLLVLARPYAYAMRGLEAQNAESTISNINNREWTALSQIEQAKVSLAIAHYAFTQLDNLQSET
ncbi:hypothetical protein H6G81_07340 [Scytonema hofmannii FACHB-248]|uniref:Uncharacterized protein n=1 Tax=Scytonema hofmannii FACHB-248 TaxID=1842502 RepID=A0ABR8GLR3_9CYAN|nr:MULTISPECIES: hypothetical protein [Nostocales]MBD2604350.1 hypothetical protein [Scytonema hofmannii FACHB-248]